MLETCILEIAEHLLWRRFRQSPCMMGARPSLCLRSMACPASLRANELWGLGRKERLAKQHGEAD